MKKSILILMVAIGSVVLSSCDFAWEWGSYGTEIPTSFASIQFIDGSTGAKLDSVKLTIHESNEWTGWQDSLYNIYSDNSGRVNVPYIPNGTVELLECSKAGYVCLPDDVDLGTLIGTKTIKMFHVAYLRLRIRNVLPADSHDLLTYKTPGTDCHQRIDLEFKGAHVDTSIVIPAIAGKYPLTFEVSNPLEGRQFIDTRNFQFIENDTTTVLFSY